MPICFIIGPMSEADGVGSRARLSRLKTQVVQPVLDRITADSSTRYTVLTPYDLGLEGGSSIVRDVIHNIDRADIVVADLTDGNPNVFYELGITHALGRPCVAVMQEGQRVQFDINAYRVFWVNLRTADYAADESAYVSARDALQGPLSAAHRMVNDWSKLENPVIDYYRAPMTYISPAPALAEGYFTNFVKPVLGSIVSRRGQRRYNYDIGMAPISDNVPQSIEETTVLTLEQRERLDLHVIIPARVHLAQHEYVDRMRGLLHAALIEGDGRHYPAWLYTSGDRMHIVDVPTTLRTVETAVDRRMRYPTDHNDANWTHVESQEIDRFSTMLEMKIRTGFDNPSTRSRVQVMRSDQLAGRDGLDWVNRIFAD